VRKKNYPRFSSCLPSSPLSSHIKKQNRSSGTVAELLLNAEFKRRGIRVTPQAPLPGKPDFVIPGCRVAIFCDGDFWHGRNWRNRRIKLRKGFNSSYWCAKIRRNIERDKEVAAHLTAIGWRVMRFWETDIRKCPAKIAALVARRIGQRSQKASIRAYASGAARNRLDAVCRIRVQRRVPG